MNKHELLKKLQIIKGVLEDTDKICTGCHKTKPVTEFYPRKESGVYFSRCKECMKEENLSAYYKKKNKKD